VLRTAVVGLALRAQLCLSNVSDVILVRLSVSKNKVFSENYR